MAEDVLSEAVEPVEVPPADSNAHQALAEAKRLEAQAANGTSDSDIKAAAKRREAAHREAREAAVSDDQAPATAVDNDNETQADKDARTRSPQGRSATQPGKQTTAADKGKA